jgi:hypothetical protein
VSTEDLREKKEHKFAVGEVGWYLVNNGYKPLLNNNGVISGWVRVSDRADRMLSTSEAWDALKTQLWPDYKRIERESRRAWKVEYKEILSKKGRDDQTDDNTSRSSDGDEEYSPYW